MDHDTHRGKTLFFPTNIAIPKSWKLGHWLRGKMLYVYSSFIYFYNIITKLLQPRFLQPAFYHTSRSLKKWKRPWGYLTSQIRCLKLLLPNNPPIGYKVFWKLPNKPIIPWILLQPVIPLCHNMAAFRTGGMLLVEMSCTSIVFCFKVSSEKNTCLISSGHLPENRPNPGPILNIYIQTSKKWYGRFM